MKCEIGERVRKSRISSSLSLSVVVARWPLNPLVADFCLLLPPIFSRSKAPGMALLDCLAACLVAFLCCELCDVDKVSTPSGKSLERGKKKL